MVHPWGTYDDRTVGTSERMVSALLADEWCGSPIDPIDGSLSSLGISGPGEYRGDEGENRPLSERTVCTSLIG
jgi:hypothetical protein